MACLWTVSIIVYLFGFGMLMVRLPDVIRFVGAVGMCICVPLSLWIYRTLGAHFSTKLQLLDNHQLVSSGPYRFVRHPMYATFFLCVLSTGLISGSGVVLITGLTTFVTMALRVEGEERMLLERFGTEYRAYMNTTGAFIPRFRFA
ncbi:MAG: isoprenylcysteine carboxylmethyltransferase family protein [bacterium]|nr:isoprenylcysteine carboxylmethyltransferase family protein [bacterium]